MEQRKDQPAAPALKEAADVLARAVALLRVHYPGWNVNQAAVPGRMAQVTIRLASGPSGYGVSARGYCPADLLGSRMSGLGTTSRDYPAGLWPLLLCLKIAFKLRVFGWKTALGWPSQILVCHRTAGIVQSFSSNVGIFFSMELALGAWGGAKADTNRLALSEAPNSGPFDLEPFQVIPSVVQGLLEGLESPWPRAFVLKHYRDWCATIGREIAAGQCANRYSGAIAVDIDDEARIVLERDGHRIGTLCYAPAEEVFDGQDEG